ncbi:PEP-utilizing enzyme [Spectribacter hydrogenooxidans]|uniref:PEP-utilizing enzyme n=1 Tax=Spectribacter hydrogenoxidans TaxID=3075608 RepID=A0ABU3C1F2_9GAMM|nr:PEP-utilizing enzyme [Salinisphaera sp. W335]MDT0635196.1 PEP-utilizing enzyme [Salinisphaera sp. W335]
MARLPLDADKFGDQTPSAVADAFHGAIHDLIRERLDANGGDWTTLVTGDAASTYGAEDFRAVEQQLLDTGHRFDWSAAISPQERPDAYQPAAGVTDDDLKTFCFQHPDAPTGEPEADGREQRGCGDNVVKYGDNLTGTARYVRSSARVLQWLTDGVPNNTVAVIDDSGGTLTAPILEQFAGVICAGGTVRSHLGILTREYGIPCLMNAKVDGIMEGDTVEIEVSAKAKTADDYQSGREVTARVWRLNQ